MRILILPFALWVGALQAIAPTQDSTELLSAAAALASLTIMIYRLGVSRQEMVDTKHNIGGEISRYREEFAEQFQRLENRFAAVERFIDAATEHRIGIEQWQGVVDTTLEAIDDCIVRFDNAGSAAVSSKGAV